QASSLSASNLAPQSQTPKSASVQPTQPGSPSTSMRTNISTTNPPDSQHFSSLPAPHSPVFPAQQARLHGHPSNSAADIPALANTPGSPVKDSANYQRPARSGGMVLSSGVPAPQPQTQLSSSSQQQPPPLSLAHAASQTQLQRSPEQASSSGPMHFEGIEPRIFPGVVSRHRRSSVQRPSSSSFSDKGDGDGASWSGFRRVAGAGAGGGTAGEAGGEVSVVEETGVEAEEE
ncbi:hypothetical protein K432DRAFT_396775, partial [Lepidopterella palustris CBS 459.81]